MFDYGSQDREIEAERVTLGNKNQLNKHSKDGAAETRCVSLWPMMPVVGVRQKLASQCTGSAGRGRPLYSPGLSVI